MPRRIVKQPNGLYAEFSTIVDAFTVMNMTENEAYIHCRREMGHISAYEKVQRGVKDQKYYHGPTDYGDGTWRWNYDLETVRDIHGDKEADKCIQLCSIPREEWLAMFQRGDKLPDGMEWVDFGEV